MMNIKILILFSGFTLISSNCNCARDILRLPRQFFSKENIPQSEDRNIPTRSLPTTFGGINGNSGSPVNQYPPTTRQDSSTGTGLTLSDRMAPATSISEQLIPSQINGDIERNDININKSNPFEKFNTNLFQAVAIPNINRNVIYSPFSLQTLLSFIYLGAESTTAQELQKALHLPTEQREVASLFQNTFKHQKSNNAMLITANKMYYNSRLQLEKNYEDVGKNFFDSEIEAMEFSYPTTAAQHINSWVSSKTQNRINNLISPGVLDATTPAILVNAIYFKAKWANEFSTMDTQKQNFVTINNKNVPVDMMYNEDSFRYGELANLKAKVLEMPYLDSELSMMFILPNEATGLNQLEQSLGGIDLSSISSQLNLETVTVRIPKFRIEFDQDMLAPLNQLNIRELFTSHAKLYGFFGRNQPVGISRVQHKAFLEVNEAGSEAAAASFAKFIPLSLPAKTIDFTANHPFVFAIRSPNAVYFVGHVVDFKDI